MASIQDEIEGFNKDICEIISPQAAIASVLVLLWVRIQEAGHTG